MKKLLMILAAVGVILSLVGAARAAVVTFQFDPNDLVDLYPGSAGMSDVTGENKATQPNARRVHQVWANTFYETFYNPAAPHTQPDDYDTYVSWRGGLGAGEGIAAFNTWLLDNPNARSWGETIVARTDAPPGVAGAADGWTGEIIDNPWGAGYLVQWYTDDSTKYLRPGGADIGDFSFTVDAYVDTNENGWDESDPGVVMGESYRIWFGGANYGDGLDGQSVYFDDSGGFAAEFPTEAYGSGFEGVLDIKAIPEPATLIIWSLLGALGIVYGWRRRQRTA